MSVSIESSSSNRVVMNSSRQTLIGGQIDPVFQTVGSGDLVGAYSVRRLPIPAATKVQSPLAFGGNSVYTLADGSYVHVFTSSGTFQVNQPIVGAQVLVVAGGGSGGSGGTGNGGGGAGGVLFQEGQSIPLGVHTVTIGNGGARSIGLGNDGENSSFGSLVAFGGGGGGTHKADTNSAGRNGGSGGGAGTDFSVRPGGTGVTGQGNSGGSSAGLTGAGGGGGAGEPGANGTSTPTNGRGGNGRYFSQFSKITGSPLGWFGGGGGGGGSGGSGAGGAGGGGAGAINDITPGSSAIANTGGGGGGCRSGSTGELSGAGGSGIVIIRYYIPNSNYRGPTLRIRRDTDNALADVWTDTQGGVTKVSEVTTSGGEEILDWSRLHVFRTVGNSTLTVNASEVVDVLVVAGGGGGGSGFESAPGSGRGSGGGGAGGLIYQSGVNLPSSSYNVTVGAGGNKGAFGSNGTNGGNSVFGTLITSIGGGYGAVQGSTANSGGSGGGAPNIGPGNSTISIGGNGTPGQGFKGGDGNPDLNNGGAGGGGGGAGGVGGNGLSLDGGIGGKGRSIDITGSLTVYASGGKGGDRGTWNVQTVAKSDALPNTGNGGEGGNGGYGGRGGNGGSGIVIVRVHPKFVGREALSSWLGTSTGTVAIWYDQSGSGNHATTIRGNPRVTLFGTQNYLYGTTLDGIRFPAAILPSTYTLFHVARWGGSNRQRIFDGVSNNWLSGFYGWPSTPLTGVAFHGGWITSTSTNHHGDNLIVTVDQNTPNLYRSNGVNRTTVSSTGTSAQLSINHGLYTPNPGADERSDWIVHEVLVYNTTLSLQQILETERALMQRYLGSTDEISLTARTGARGLYALRELSGTWNGPTLTVTRSSDGQRADLYFDPIGKFRYGVIDNILAFKYGNNDSTGGIFANQLNTNGVGTVQLVNAGADQTEYTWTPPSGSWIADVLVVAGGGGGGNFGGGGGAGGLIYFITTINTNNTYQIKVGRGGTGATSGSSEGAGLPGYNSSFEQVESIGGGFGGAGTPWNIAAGNGGSGGGGGARAGVAGTGTINQGYNGGAGTTSGGTTYYRGGGGGGAGSEGTTATTISKCGNGGSGKYMGFEFTVNYGANGYFAGGGGGGGVVNAYSGTILGGDGGIGGGGKGGDSFNSSSTQNPGANGISHTGGGGGAGAYQQTGGNGGSGIVLIRVKSRIRLTQSDFLNWLNGAVPLVETWYDQSGNNNHATQSMSGSRPILRIGGTLNDYSIEFEGSKLLNLPDNISSIQDITVLAKSSQNSNAVGFLISGFTPFKGTFASASFTTASTDDHRIFLYSGTSGAKFALGSIDNTFEADISTPLYEESYRVIQKNAAGTVTSYLNGTQVRTRTQTSSVTPNKWKIGGIDYTFTMPDGEIVYLIGIYRIFHHRSDGGFRFLISRSQDENPGVTGLTTGGTETDSLIWRNTIVNTLGNFAYIRLNNWNFSTMYRIRNFSNYDNRFYQADFEDVSGTKQVPPVNTWFNAYVYAYKSSVPIRQIREIGIYSNVLSSAEIQSLGVQAQPKSTGALDNIGVSPIAAFGLRLLINSYTGPLVRVRRSTDNAEADVFFNYIGVVTRVVRTDNTATFYGRNSLSTFQGAATLFVTTWYDQSGNGRNATQTTTSIQPKLIQLYDRYIIYFDPSTNDVLSFANTDVLTLWSQFFVNSLTNGYATLIGRGGSDVSVRFESRNVAVNNGDLFWTSDNSAFWYVNNVYGNTLNAEPRITLGIWQTLYAVRPNSFSGFNMNEIGRTNQGLGLNRDFNGTISEIIMFSTALSSSLSSQFYNARYMRIQGAIDGITSLPSAAYSLRLLYGNYTGPIVRVRRSTDNVEADIYFDYRGSIVFIISSGIATYGSTALSTFQGAATLFVTTWYDQSGSANHATNATTSTQPQLVQQSGKYVVYFDGDSDRLGFTDIDVRSVWVQFYVIALSNAFATIIGRAGIDKSLRFPNRNVGGDANDLFWTSDNSASWYVNNIFGNVLTSEPRITLGSWQTFYGIRPISYGYNMNEMGYRSHTPSNRDFNGYIGELIMYNTTQSSNLSSLFWNSKYIN